MGKNEKTELGRALMKHHNQMIQQSKEKGRIYRNRNKKILESVTDVSDIEAIIEQAEESERLFASGHPLPNILINLDTSSASSDMTPEERRKQQKEEEALYFRSLRVPRRPPWNTGMSMEELDANERRAFLEWRRRLARLEENEKLVLTPFEKNLDIWRQLWRVIERSDLLVMVVDARDPLFYRCSDLEAYAREVDEHKRTLLLVNKADLLPLPVRKQWAEYFSSHDILFVFWSAKAASAAMEGKNLHIFELQEDEGGAKIYGRDELLARLQTEAERISTVRRKSEPKNEVPASKSVVVGFVGYPNVGKSSTINALVGQKRTGVTSTPGKTKHFQTLIISDELTLCDCPGLVFPSFSSSRYEMVASGVLPIDRMTEQREAVRVVAERVPRRVIEAVYNITLPKPKPYEPAARPPLASELLRGYCASRGHVASSGLPDETRAARQILKDYIDGKLPHYESPPRMSNEDDRVGKPPSRISNEDDTVGNPPSRMSNEDDTVGKSPSRISNEDDPVGNPHSRMSNEDDPVGKSPSRISNEDDTVGNPPSRMSNEDDTVGNPPSRMSNEDDTVGKSPSRISNGDERVGRGSAPGPTSPANHESDSSDAENRHGAHILYRVLHDLDSFDVANGLSLSSSKKAAVPQKKAKASHKQHKKPQRKKNRSWRVGNDDGDGMPVVRVFQKPANACPLPLRAR